jgi:DNA-binding transcriptional LysR family regulator
VRSTSVFAHVEATAAGAGIGILPDFLGDADPRLVRVLDGAWAHPLAYWAVARDEGPRNPAVAATLQAITEHIAAAQNDSEVHDEAVPAARHACRRPARR